MGVCTGDENDGWKLSAYLVARMPIVAAGNLVRGQRHDVHFSVVSKSCILVMQVAFLPLKFWVWWYRDRGDRL